MLRQREEVVPVLLVAGAWEVNCGLVAARAVNSFGGNFRLLVAGRGRSHMARGPFIQRLGAVRDLPALYAAADIFLLPTLYDPFSNACLEALAAGLPVITTRDNGFSEIIENGVHGSILDSASDTAQIRDALLFWAETERRVAARSAILERARQFDISVNVDRTLAVLHHAPKAEVVSGKIRKT